MAADRLPAASDAASTVVRAFLGAYGPATPELFDKVWLSRGNTRKALVRSWFAALEDDLREDVPMSAVEAELSRHASRGLRRRK